MGLQGTLNYCSAIRCGAMERRFLTIEDIREITVSPVPYNPMDSCRGPCCAQERVVFERVFDRALKDCVDWGMVKDEARKVLEKLQEGVKVKTETREETRPFELRNSKLFSEWSTAWSSRNVSHLLSLFAAEGVYECLSSSVRVVGQSSLAAYFSRLFHTTEMMLEVDRILTDGKGEWFLHWTRVGSRCFGVQFQRSLGPIWIRGQSKLQVRDFDLGGRDRLTGRIEQCVEIWAIEDPDLLRKARELGFPDRVEL
jgi:hypothetical protein